MVLPVVVVLSLSHFNGNANDGKEIAKGNDHNPPMLWTPEANTGIVLIPFVGAVLLFSSLQLFRVKAAQKNGARP